MVISNFAACVFNWWVYRGNVKRMFAKPKKILKAKNHIGVANSVDLSETLPSTPHPHLSQHTDLPANYFVRNEQSPYNHEGQQGSKSVQSKYHLVDVVRVFCFILLYRLCVHITNHTSSPPPLLASFYSCTSCLI